MLVGRICIGINCLNNENSAFPLVLQKDDAAQTSYETVLKYSERRECERGPGKNASVR
jgi:hypothetical protein